MIHFTGMAKFVKQHIVDEMRRKQHEIKAQIDIFSGRTASPVGMVAFDRDVADREVIFFGELLESYGKIIFGLFAKNTFNYFVKPFLHSLFLKVGSRRANYP